MKKPPKSKTQRTHRDDDDRVEFGPKETDPKTLAVLRQSQEAAKARREMQSLSDDVIPSESTVTWTTNRLTVFRMKR